MSFPTIIDDYLRRSFAARFIPHLKKSNPRLYGFALRLRDVLFPVRSKLGLSRYQLRALEKFIKLTGTDSWASSILEIGSDEDAKILRELKDRGFSNVTGINPYLDIWVDIPSGVKAFSSACTLMNSDARKLPHKDESFSAIFSIAAFEHINDLDKALLEMYRVLKPGGYVYADFGPIWSSSVGHHVYAVVDGEEARHWKPEKNPIPNHAHLLLTSEEMRESLLKHVSPKLLNAILEWVYFKPDINRLFFEDYENLFNNTPFEILFMQTVEEHVDKNKLKILCKKYPAYRKFGVRSIEIFMKKP